MKKGKLFQLCIHISGVTILFLSIQCKKTGYAPNTSTDSEQYVTHQARTFFPKPDLMKIGVFYYPEQWPHEQWARDFNNIASIGFEFTHLAEFSWALLEPEEGKFDFTWLDEAVDLANRAGLKIILCTPTLCPPAWMGNKYPEIYLVGSNGRRREHGIRANASLTNPYYQKFVDIIVTAMARHYGSDSRIWGWQIDNEPLAIPDYSPSARIAFQNWLKKKYSTIDKLNDCWAGNFWSTRYDNFEQILIPNEAMNEEDKLSPHALLDFQRFTADVTAGFLNRQADIVRKHILSEQWITTNYVNASMSSDPRRSDHLDFPTFTMYPVSGRNELGGNNFRTGIPFRIYEACDYHRPIRGVTGLMELQPGQVNWGTVNPQLIPGTVHMWIMQAFGGGCSFLCTYRYRHPLKGSEMYHEGIVGTDGVSLSQGGREFVKAIQEMTLLRAEYDSTACVPKSLARRKTALLWSHDVMWDLDIQKQTVLWNTWRHRNNYSAAVKSAGAPLDFISEEDDFTSYPFLIAPAYQLVDSALVQKWRDYVEAGGHLILSCRTGQKDKDGHFFEAGWADPIRSLIGSEIEFFDMLPPDVIGTVSTRNMRFQWNAWGEILSPYPGTEVLATYTDQYYAGKAAVISRHLGKGTVTFIGVASIGGQLEHQIIRDVYHRAGVAIEDLPKGIYMEWRDGFFVAVNYTDQDYYLPIPAHGQILIGSNPLKPAQAIVWKLK
jgi:beta-galactosidase